MPLYKRLLISIVYKGTLKSKNKKTNPKKLSPTGKELFHRYILSPKAKSPASPNPGSM